MKITEIYLDLQKAEPKTKGKKTVWKLESESFKEPLTLQIKYDPEDKKRAEEIKKEAEDALTMTSTIFKQLIEKELVLKEEIEVLKKEIEVKNNLISQLEKQIASYKKEETQFLLEQRNQKQEMEKQSGTISHLKEVTTKMTQSLQRKPKVFGGSIFVSWNEIVFLDTINLSAWDRIQIMEVQILEKNEYVENPEVETTYEKVSINQDPHLPTFRLRSRSKVDTPTATIKYVLTYIPA